MKDSVRLAFVPLTISFEGGFIDYMFPDVKKLISTGFGLLLDPVSLAIGLPWRHPDGSLASRGEIAAEWSSLKNFVEQNPGSEFRSYKTFEGKTSLRLGHEGLYQAFQGKLNQNEVVLRAGFPEWDSWPADAQLATLSMAWACGPAFYLPTAGRNYWPKLTAALRAKHFRTAAVECFMNEEAKNPGIIPRNKANRVMYLNAAKALDLELPAEELYYPTDIASDVPEEEITQPNIHVMADWAIVHPKVQLGDDEPPDDPPPQAA